MWYYYQSRACTLSLVFLILYRLSFSVSFHPSQCIWVCSRAGASWTIRCFIIVRTTLLSNSSSSIIKSCQLSNPDTSSNIPRHVDQLSINPLVVDSQVFPLLSRTSPARRARAGYAGTWSSISNLGKTTEVRPSNEKRNPKKARSIQE